MSDRHLEPNEDDWQRPSPSWSKKFADAFVGIRQGMQGQTSFLVHVPLAIGVVILAAVLQVPLAHWCLLLLCIAAVNAAELFNSSLEWICRSITHQYDENIERALKISSGAVLILAIISSIIGVIVFISGLLALISG